MVPLCVLSAAAVAKALRGAPSTPGEHLSPIKRRKKRTRDDVFSEILQASAASDHDQRIWRMNIANYMEKERADGRKESQQEEELEFNGASLAANMDAADSCGPTGSKIPLQSMESSITAPPYIPINISRGIRGRIRTAHRGTLSTTTASNTLSCESHDVVCVTIMDMSVTSHSLSSVPKIC
ncbi:hypothetical protein UY3_10676 [Chelonia mydas]|uniref:Uncharacterized protein n=1 Tax=Chelonia mydas TaxID=8469 RepID=M7BVM9_CHEMY|nr:hypothetical protein UY3_10676 [Chelonia mydas]